MQFQKKILLEQNTTNVRCKSFNCIPDLEHNQQSNPRLLYSKLTISSFVLCLEKKRQSNVFHHLTKEKEEPYSNFLSQFKMADQYYNMVVEIVFFFFLWRTNMVYTLCIYVYQIQIHGQDMQRCILPRGVEEVNSPGYPLHERPPKLIWLVILYLPSLLPMHQLLFLPYYKCGWRNPTMPWHGRWSYLRYKK